VNEVTIVVTVRDQTFQDLERIRRHALGIFNDIDKNTKSLPEKIAKTVTSSAKKAATEGLSFSLSAIKDAPFELKAAGVAFGTLFGVTAASAAAAILSGGVLAGAAAAGVAGGLKLAARSPEVQDAAAVLGETVLKHLEAMSLSLGFNFEAIAALDQVGEAWARNSGKVRDALAASVQYVQPLVEGMIDFAEGVLPGLTKAIQRAEPVVRVLERGLGETGDTIGKALDRISENGDEAAAALQLVFDATNIMINGLGKAISAGTKFFHTILDIGSVLTGAVEDWFPDWTPIAKHLRQVNDEFERLLAIAEGRGGVFGWVGGVDRGTDSLKRLAEQERAAKRELDKLNQSFADSFNIMMSVEQANIGVKLGLIELKKELEDNGRTVNANTEAGLRSRDAILEQIGALERQRTAAIEAGAGSAQASEAANASYIAGIEAIRSMLRQLKLLTPEMDALLNQWVNLAKPKTIPVTVRVNVVDPGGLLRARGTYALASGGMAPTPVPGAASGMLIGGGSLTRVGEHGEELVRLPPGAQVYNNGQTRRMDSTMGGWGGGGKLAVEVYPAPGLGSAFADEMIKVLRYRVRTESGGDVSAFFDAYAG
jgi:hypothetical protein